MQKYKISSGAAVLMSINTIIGVGVYFGPQSMAAAAGNASFLGWFAAALLFFPLAWCLALISRLTPESGGFYSYCKYGLNKTAGFLASWSYFLAFLAVNSTILAALKGVIFNQLHLPWLQDYQILLNAALGIVLFFMSLLNVTLISKIQSVATLLKLIPMFLVIGIFWFYWDSSVLSITSQELSALSATLPLALFGFWGFESCCNIGHLLVEGPRALFKVILLAFLISAGLYGLFHFGILHIMGVHNLVQYGVPAFAQFLGIQSPWLHSLFAIGFIWVFFLSYSNSSYGITLFNSSNLANLAERNLIFFSKKLAALTGNGRPVWSIFAQCFLVFLLISLVPNTAVLAALSNLFLIIVHFLVLSSLTVIQLRQRTYSSLIMTIAGFCAASVIAYLSWQGLGTVMSERILYTLPLLIGLGAGWIMFKIKTSRDAVA